MKHRILIDVSILVVLAFAFIEVPIYIVPFDNVCCEGLLLEANTSDLKNKVNITINKLNLSVDIASTPEEQTKGLSIKESLEKNEGMIFPYDTSQILSFWMKNMKFPIDILWLDADKRVVHIEENLEPCPPLGPCPSYSTDTLSQYVLEIAGGLSRDNGIAIGTQAEFDLSAEE